MVLMVPSGCGTSTLLIPGLQEVTQGEILINRRVVNDRHPEDRDTGVVFQNHALCPHVSLEGNMAFSPRLRGMARQPRHRRIEGAAGLLHIGALSGGWLGNLSGGRCRRVAMGRALVRDTKVFLFDEPPPNPDAKLRVQVRAEIEALQGRSATTVHVTHDQVEDDRGGPDRGDGVREGRADRPPARPRRSTREWLPRGLHRFAVDDLPRRGPESRRAGRRPDGG